MFINSKENPNYFHVYFLILSIIFALIQVPPFVSWMITKLLPLAFWVHWLLPHASPIILYSDASEISLKGKSDNFTAFPKISPIFLYYSWAPKFHVKENPSELASFHHCTSWSTGPSPHPWCSNNTCGFPSLCPHVVCLPSRLYISWDYWPYTHL